jgi:predicted secreted hydrolase
MGEFKTEWWYWNGHVQTNSGRKLDFILSFTRHDTRGDRMLGIPLWHLPRDVHLGLFGLTDRERLEHHVATKINVPDFWAADAEQERPFVYHDSWAAQWVDDRFYVTARARDVELHLQMTPTKPAALYGEEGYVELAGTPHYVYSYTQMKVKGALLEGESSHPISGTAWFDHFVGHPSEGSARSWDWVSLQLDDGTEYMLAQLRNDDASTTPYANFEVAPDGSVRRLPEGSVTWNLKRTWRSQASDERYRVEWTLVGPDFELELHPIVDDQEFHKAPEMRLWEGAIAVSGIHAGRQVSGEGFLETVAESGLPTHIFSFGR